MEPVIQVQDLVKIYMLGEVEVQALRGVLPVDPKGEFVAIMGRLRLRQINLYEYLRIPGSAHPGLYLLEGMDGKNLQRDELAEIRT